MPARPAARRRPHRSFGASAGRWPRAPRGLAREIDAWLRSLRPPYAYAAGDSEPDHRALSIGSSGSLPQSRVEQVAQPVAEQVGAEHDERDRDPGHGREPPGVGEIVASLGEHE